MSVLLAAALLSGCGDARARCFPADVELPDAALLRAAQLGGTARDLGEALLAGDVARATALLRADPQLARVDVGGRDMLELAVAGCAPDAIDAVIAAGAPADGAADEGMPLQLALTADTPALAHRLLSKGASPTPRGAPLSPMREAIMRSSIGGVRMLLDFRADPDAMESTGKRPLHIALDTERFRIAELLLARGADPWAIDIGGANLATSAYTPMMTADAEEAQAQRRLQQRLRDLRWPDPAPTPAQVRRLALDGAWPPAGAKGGRVPPEVLALIAENARRKAVVN